MKNLGSKNNKGMTYVELIVVLAIFALITAVTVYNYRGFQSKVDIKNLGSDIALKIVEAQNSSLSGKLPSRSYDPNTWKPSYGVYFDITADNKSFIYFTDLNADRLYDTSSTCPATGECLDKPIITKGNSISGIAKYSGATPTAITNLTITFKRPDSNAWFSLNGVPTTTGFDYFQITVISPATPTQITSKISIYPSGRIEVN